MGLSLPEGGSSLRLSPQSGGASPLGAFTVWGHPLGGTPGASSQGCHAKALLTRGHCLEVHPWGGHCLGVTPQCPPGELQPQHRAVEGGSVIPNVLLCPPPVPQGSPLSLLLPRHRDPQTGLTGEGGQGMGGADGDETRKKEGRSGG